MHMFLLGCSNDLFRLQIFLQKIDIIIMHCVERVAVLDNIIIVYAIRSQLFFIRLYEQSTTFATE